MRTIKFNFYNTRTEKYTRWGDANASLPLMAFETHEHIEFLQYTGLKDKNGVDVYEGDVLVKEFHWPFYVGFNDGCFVMVPCEPVQKINWNWNAIAQNKINDWVIEGNIYENPDLVKS
jgi:uncharacterized phage protein (TIGR01671 family)